MYIEITVEFAGSPSDFGINLSSASYKRAGGNGFISDDGVLDQCTEFAFGRALEKGLISSNSGIGGKINVRGDQGNAGNWDDSAGADSWTRQATVNSFAVWDPNQGGAGDVCHVAFVERVNSNGSFLVSEFNWDTYLDGRGIGKFNSRTISPGQSAFNTAKFILVIVKVLVLSTIMTLLLVLVSMM